MEAIAVIFCMSVFSFFFLWGWLASINLSVYGVTRIPKDGSYWRYKETGNIVKVMGCGSKVYCEELFTKARYSERSKKIDYKVFFKVCDKIKDFEAEKAKEEGLRALAELA